MSDRKFRNRWYQFWLPVCTHDWRPAAILFGQYPAKVCDDCGYFCEMTRAEFYALFGSSFDVLKANLAGISGGRP